MHLWNKPKQSQLLYAVSSTSVNGFHHCCAATFSIWHIEHFAVFSHLWLNDWRQQSLERHWEWIYMTYTCLVTLTKEFHSFTPCFSDLCVRLCWAERAGLVTLLSCSFSPQCWTGWSWLSHSWTGSWTVNWCQSVSPGWRGAWWCLGTRGPSPAACTRGPLRGPETKRGAPHSVRGCINTFISVLSNCLRWYDFHSSKDNKVIIKTCLLNLIYVYNVIT